MVNPGNAFYTVPGTFQSQLTPRMFGGDYGANITYNLPSRENLAVPQTPLGFANSVTNQQPICGGNQVKEGFCAGQSCGGAAKTNNNQAAMHASRNMRRDISGSGPSAQQSSASGLPAPGGGPVSCVPGGAELGYRAPPTPVFDYANGNYQDVLNDVYSKPNSLKAMHNNLPVGDMTTINALGVEDQPIVYDRYIYANRNTRLRKGGDPIRGDLPIVPEQTGWFRPSVQPNIDLQQGAMNVLGGINNETSKQLADLIYTTSGRSETAIGGVNMMGEVGNPGLTSYSNRRTGINNLARVNGGNQYNTSLSAGNGDVLVTAFP
jgi:hypothetical protein